jgi:hypothetical protein
VNANAALLEETTNGTILSDQHEPEIEGISKAIFINGSHCETSRNTQITIEIVPNFNSANKKGNETVEIRKERFNKHEPK